MQILQQLDLCKGYPDFNNYLAFIFAQGDTLAIEVRPAWRIESFKHPDEKSQAHILAETVVLLVWLAKDPATSLRRASAGTAKRRPAAEEQPQSTVCSNNGGVSAVYQGRVCCMLLPEPTVSRPSSF